MGATPSSADLVSVTRYNAAGQTIETRLPSGPSGGDAHSTLTTYYTAGSSGTCVNTALAGLMCSSAPAAQPATGPTLPTITAAYTVYDQPATETADYGSGVTRTTTTGYDPAGRIISTATAVTPTNAGGTAIPAASNEYDPTTGLATTQSTTDGSGTKTLTTGYDNLGQATSYTDATGTVSTKTYDLNGRPSASFDGLHTTAYTYDSSTDHRGFLTSISTGFDGAPDTFSGTYNEAGNLDVQTYPNGLTATTSYDNADTATSLIYAKDAGEWLTFTQTVGASGQIVAQSSPQSGQTYTFDSAGRLTATEDTVSADGASTACTTRTYTFDKDSNRIANATYPDDGSDPANPTCTTSTTPTSSATHTYDGGDRLDDAGYAYDALGRTTTVPSGDAQGAATYAALTGDMTIGYYSNDLVRNQTQGGVTRTYQLDPTQARIESLSDATSTTTNHYADEAIHPAGTQH